MFFTLHLSHHNILEPKRKYRGFWRWREQPRKTRCLVVTQLLTVGLLADQQ